MTKNNKIDYYQLFLDEKDRFNTLYHNYQKLPQALPTVLEKLQSYHDALENSYIECYVSYLNYEKHPKSHYHLLKANYHLAESYVEQAKYFLALETVTYHNRY